MRPVSVAFTALWLLVGCLGGFGYRVEGVEAQRAVRELGQSESVVVDATEHVTDRRVRLKLKREDEVVLKTRGVEEEDAKAMPLWTESAVLEPDNVEHFDFEGSSPRENWLVAGVLVSAVSVVAPAIMAVGSDRPVYAIPLVGPGLMLSAKKHDSTCRSPVDCAAGGTMNALVDSTTMTLGALWLTLQVVGLGATVYGIWFAEPSREQGDVPMSAARWPVLTFAPAPGGGGVQVVGTF